MMRWDVLIRLLKDKPTLVGAEIGVRGGANTLRLLLNLPQLSKMYAIDPWEYYEGYESDRIVTPTMKAAWPSQPQLSAAERDFRAGLLKHNLTGRCVVLKMFSADAAAQVPDLSLDFVFIDANHAYEYCKQDIELWTPKAKVGGIVSGHDYKNTWIRGHTMKWGVTDAVNEAFGEAKVHKEPDYVWWVVKE